jgi:Subtilase family/Putative binding domain, N-terminal
LFVENIYAFSNLNRQGSSLGMFKKILIGAAVACAMDSGAWAQVAPARVVLGQTAQVPLQASADPQIAGTLGALRTAAANKGSVRVIFGVRAGFAAVGALGTASAAQQRNDIAGVQAVVLGKVPALGLPGKNLKQFANIPFMAAEVDAADLERLAGLTEITSIQEDYLSAPTLAESTPLIGADAAWGTGITGTGQMVAVLDTGTDRTHPFFAGKVLSEGCYSTTSAAQGSTSVCPGGAQQSTAVGSGAACDSSISGCDHGNHVAGIVAGKNASFSGVARDASILAMQVFSRFEGDSCSGASPCPLSFGSDQILALERVFELRNTFNIAAANMSLGGGQFFANCDDRNQALKAAIDNLRSVNIATIIASGNSGYKDSMGGPACISTAISVGATWKSAGGNNSCLGNNLGSASTDAVTCFSNSAPFLHLLAPGALINSATYGSAYGGKQGTSMATPMVAGAWALLKQRNPGLSVNAALSALSSTGIPVTDPRNGVTKPRIQVDAALNVVSNVSCTYAVSPATVAALNNTAQTGTPLAVTTPVGCAWTAASNSSWLTVTDGASSRGPGSVTYTVSDNTGAASRSATLTVASQVVTVTQVGATSAGTSKVDVRTYVPSAVSGSGYTSFLRVINTGSVSTPISIAPIDGTTGVLGLPGQLVANLPAGAAMTFSAAQVEAALGSVAAAQRPRIRVFAAADATIEAQSFLLQPGGAFNEVSGSQGGSSVNVRTYVPAAAAPTGYVSSIRVINTGSVATAVTVARIDPVTGQTGTPRSLSMSLPMGGAVTFSAVQIESALGFAIDAAERPRLLVAGASATLDVQSFLIQPGGAFTEVSTGKAGSTIDVPSYVPAASAAYKTFLRVINTTSTATPVTATLLDGTTGVAVASATVINSLTALAATTLSATLIEAALGVSIAANDRPRLRISSAGAGLEVQSFLLQPGGAYNEISNAITGTSVIVRTYVPAADSVTGYTSYLRVINTGSSPTPVTVALVDTAGVRGNSVVLANLPAGAAQTFNSSQIEAALGSPVAAGSRPRIAVSGTTVLEVQSFLTQPGGAFTEVSGGQ